MFEDSLNINIMCSDGLNDILVLEDYFVLANSSYDVTFLVYEHLRQNIKNWRMINFDFCWVFSTI